MWLLNSCSWELKEFISYKQAPAYAVLSHTWGDEEISFRDWQKEHWEVVEKKEGFSKIKHCCEQAAAEGLEWVWIDTCCIDKRSSTELSEAINSMFQWYKRAAVCYTYLFDVQDDIESNIAGSRWVTRGWTLQELIAPREVVFYSSDWRALGTRSQLSAHLAAVTKIHEPFLVGRNLEEASIAQRMSWAAMRSTAREEDVAYCLLGIFNINLPLIYGEGPKAFRRLQEALVREYPEDHSLFAWGKIVKELVNGVEDDDLVWGWESPNKKNIPRHADIELRGLLAESPRDFEHAGQIVVAPNLGYYFLQVQNPVPVFAGHTWRVDLPSVTGPWIAKHLQRPPVVQLFVTEVIILLCGQWNDTHDDFHYAAIPGLQDSGYFSRPRELLVSEEYTYQEYNSAELTNEVSEFTFGRTLPLAPRNGDIVIRRMGTYFETYMLSHIEVDFSTIHGLIIVPRKLEDALTSIGFHQDGEGHGFTLTIVRHGALDHAHEDSTQGRNCGTLTFKFGIFTHPGQDTREFDVIDTGEDPTHVVAPTKLKSTLFDDAEEATDNHFDHWGDLEYGHGMALPRDEWRFNAVDLAKIHISVERIYLDADDSDDDSDNDECHPFVDVLDMVIKKDPEDTSSEDGSEDEDGSAKGSSDEGEVDTEATDKDGAVEKKSQLEIRKKS